MFLFDTLFFNYSQLVATAARVATSVASWRRWWPVGAAAGAGGLADGWLILAVACCWAAGDTGGGGSTHRVLIKESNASSDIT